MFLTSTWKRGNRHIGLTRSVLHSMLFRLTGMALAFLLHILLARLMGPKGYGDYAVIITWLNLLLVVSLFGMDTAVLRFLPAAVGKKDYPHASGFLRFSYRWITVLSILCSIAALLILIFKSKRSNWSFNEGMFWALFILPVLAFIYQASAVLRSFHRIKASMLPVFILLPVFMAVSCGYYFISNGKLPVDAVMFTQLVCTVLIGFIISRISGKQRQERLEEAEPEYHRKLWLSAAASFFIVSLVDMLLRQTDILLIGYMLNNAKAGQYAVAARITSLVAFGLSVTDYVYMPRIAAVYERRRLAELQKMVRQASRQIVLIALPVVVALIAAGPWLLSLFGPAFRIAYVPMLILLTGQLVNAATGMVGGLLNMTGNHRSFLLFSIICALLQFGLIYVLVPVWGLSGAAAAAALSRILLNVLAYRRVRKVMKIRPSFF